MITFGSSTITWSNQWDGRLGGRIIAEAAAAGVDVLELPLLDPASFDAALHRRQLADAGISAVVGTGLPPGLAPAVNQGAALDMLRRAVDATAELGAPVLGGVLYGTIGDRTGAPVTAGERGAIVDVLGEAARHAAAAGVTLGIEPLNRYESHLCTTVSEACEIIRLTGADNLRVSPDTFHMNIEEPDVPAALLAAGPLVGNVQVCDNDRGVPGTGSIDFVALFRALARIGFDGTILLESFAVTGPGFPPACYYRAPVCTPGELLAQSMPFLRDAAAEAGLLGAGVSIGA